MVYIQRAVSASVSAVFADTTTTVTRHVPQTSDYIKYNRNTYSNFMLFIAGHNYSQCLSLSHDYQVSHFTDTEK